MDNCRVPQISRVIWLGERLGKMVSVKYLSLAGIKLVIDDEFSLSDYGGSICAEMLDDITIPETIKQASVNGDTSNYSKIEITEFVDLENKYFGCVIGKSIDNIKWNHR